MDENFLKELKQNAAEIMQSAADIIKSREGVLRPSREEVVAEIRAVLDVVKEAFPKGKFSYGMETNKWTTVLYAHVGVTITVDNMGHVDISQRGVPTQLIDILEEKHLKELNILLANKVKEKWLAQSGESKLVKNRPGNR